MARQFSPEEIEAMRQNAEEAKRLGITISEYYAEAQMRSLLERVTTTPDREPVDILSEARELAIAYLKGCSEGCIPDTADNMQAKHHVSRYLEIILHDPDLLADFLSGEESVYIRLRSKPASPD